jgi:DNA invertase Pin-like site-specific DNA recombinase
MSREGQRDSLRPAWAGNSKIAARHLQRLALVYVRQSTPQQLVRHQESTRLQYGLVERAVALGWPREQVVVIDDDLGRSGEHAEGRPGFQKLVAEVGLDHVGVLLGVEMSRLARSCRDWYQLLEVCALFGTLIADMDGVYDPSNYNDRLLLGLKGTMSEAELHILKQRMQEGRVAKARRGELVLPVPMGYVRSPDGEVLKDPDQQVQCLVQLLFEQFEVRGSINGVLRYLVDNGLKLPVRPNRGATKGELEWRRPSRNTLYSVLRNPTYAGAYVYGRQVTDPRRKRPGRRGTGKRAVTPGDWLVLRKEQWPAYISWEQYERNLEQLARNRQQAQGTPRGGGALLAGLVRCGRCGRRMQVAYRTGNPRYFCALEAIAHGGPECQSLSGQSLDKRVSELVLKALEPSALEVSLQVAGDVEAEHSRMEETWRQRLERAQYEVDRALRQYSAVEPENRLVARTLEAVLEQKLAAQKALEEERQRWRARQPAPLTPQERETIRELAENIPALWYTPSTTPQEKQTIIRQLVEQVVVTVVGESERVTLVLHWAGGYRTETTVVRPVTRFEQLSYWPELANRLLELRHQGLTAEAVAQRLNAEGWRPPKRRCTFTGEMVRSLVSRRGLARWKGGKRKRSGDKLRPDEWRIRELAAKLSMPTVTLRGWIRRGWVRARQLDEARSSWAIEAGPEELARLIALRESAWSRAPARSKLTTAPA